MMTEVCGATNSIMMEVVGATREVKGLLYLSDICIIYIWHLWKEEALKYDSSYEVVSTRQRVKDVLVSK